MSGDHAAFTFAPTNGFSGIWHQQGRVSLESDFNEFERILDRLRRVTTHDTVGAAVVAASTPDAFKLGVNVAGELTIGAGRAYVDGILVECFGDSDPQAAVTHDAHLGHEYRSAPLSLAVQPFRSSSDGSPLLTGATNLVYLDVWQREVTVHEHPDLLEVALGGPDTTTRVQTVWQVKAIPLPDDVQDGCANDLPGTVADPSSGELTVDYTPKPQAAGPCTVPTDAGYVGLENRLYRVEIHTGGVIGAGAPPLFKWSRDNASVAAEVAALTTSAGSSVLTVTTTGRDPIRRFRIGDHVEYLNDRIEFGLYDGSTVGSIATVVSVDDGVGTITVDRDLSAVGFDAALHPRIRRWDTDGAAGVLQPVQAGPIALEDGITVGFGPDGKVLRAGDFWTFSARTATGQIVHKPANQRPHGVLHHFMRLGVVSAGAPPTVDQDCRIFWPPTCECNDCACDFCVTVESHTSGALTIQDAVDQAIAAGGGIVCIGPGVFPISSGVIVRGGFAVSIRGSGPTTVILAETKEAALTVVNSVETSALDLTVVTTGARGDDACAIQVVDSSLVSLDRMIVCENLVAFMDAATAVWNPMQSKAAAIMLSGTIVKPRIENCLLAGAIGISGPPQRQSPAKPQPLLAVDVTIRDNRILGSTAGVWVADDFGRTSRLYAGQVVIDGNTVYAPRGAIHVAGRNVLGTITIRSNLVFGDPDIGVITVATDSASVLDNTVISTPHGQGEKSLARQAGICVLSDRPGAAREVQIAGNSVTGFGAGIFIVGDTGTLTITNNVVSDCGSGIAMSIASGAESVRVTGNDIRRVESVPIDEAQLAAGVRVVGCSRIDVSNNTLRSPQRQLAEIRLDFGIAAIGCRQVEISGNMVEHCGLTDADTHSAGIISTALSADTSIAANTVGQLEDTIDRNPWYALYIGDVHPNDKEMPWHKRLIIVDDAVHWLSQLLVLSWKPAANEALLKVTGNTFDVLGPGTASAVLSDGVTRRIQTRCTFTENMARQLTPHPESAPAVILGEFESGLYALVLSGNQVTTPADIAIDIGVSIDQKKVPQLTALGNVTRGIIHVNGALLSMPWRPLNITI